MDVGAIKIFPNFSALKQAVKGGMIFENGETIKVGRLFWTVRVHQGEEPVVKECSEPNILKGDGWVLADHNDSSLKPAEEQRHHVMIPRAYLEGGD